MLIGKSRVANATRRVSRVIMVLKFKTVFVWRGKDRIKKGKIFYTRINT